MVGKTKVLTVDFLWHEKPDGRRVPNRIAFLKMLKDEDPFKKLSAVRELGNSNSPAALPFLKKALKDDSLSIRLATIDSLRKVGEIEGNCKKRSIKILENHLLDTWSIDSPEYYDTTQALEKLNGISEEKQLYQTSIRTLKKAVSFFVCILIANVIFYLVLHSIVQKKMNKMKIDKGTNVSVVEKSETNAR